MYSFPLQQTCLTLPLSTCCQDWVFIAADVLLYRLETSRGMALLPRLIMSGYTFDPSRCVSWTSAAEENMFKQKTAHSIPLYRSTVSRGLGNVCSFVTNVCYSPFGFVVSLIELPLNSVPNAINWPSQHFRLGFFFWLLPCFFLVHKAMKLLILISHKNFVFTHSCFLFCCAL